MQRKQFKIDGKIILVDIYSNGDVDIAPVGMMTCGDFARLATSVLCASNTYAGKWVSFPDCNDLEDR